QQQQQSKPFFAGVATAIEEGDGSVSPLLKNWNFNVSHHGKYVVIASEPTHLCGVDIVDTNGRGSEGGAAEDYLRYFTDHFTDDEWATIKRPADDAAKLQRFYLHWSLKEAYVKSIGQGLGYDLRRISFVPGDWVDCCSRQPGPPREPLRRRCVCPRSASPCSSSSSSAAADAATGVQTSGTSGADADGADPSRHGGASGGSDLSSASENMADFAGQGESRSGGGDEAAEQVLLQKDTSGQSGSGEGGSHGSGASRGDAADNAAEASGGGGGCWQQEDRLGCCCGVGDVTVEV
ncbi:unnamed protein product, partial [Hapterophycus canaliculatus]